MPEYTQTTHNVTITVRPVFMEDESLPHDAHYIWAYHIHLENHRNDTIQLLNRYWRITDGSGHVQEVRGPGVVGEQPILRPGEQYEYASGTHLNTPTGIMEGFYEMEVVEGETEGSFFKITIPAFSLDSPEQIDRPN